MVTNRETFASSLAFHVLVIIRISRFFQCRMDMRLMFFCFKRFALLSLKIQYFLFNFLTYILNLSVSVTKTSGPSFCIFWIKTNIWTKEIIAARIFTFDKFTLQNLAHKSGCVQTNLLYFIYITSEVKEYYEALFLSYRPQTIGSQFHSFSRQIAFIQYSGPSKHAWAFNKTVQKISKITYTASRS